MYPMALRIGMTKREFFHSTPADIRLMADAYNHKMKMRSEEAEEAVKLAQFQSWLTGSYVRIAIASAFNGKKVKYPDNPLAEKKIETAEQAAKKLNKSVEEVKMEMLFASQMIKAANSQLGVLNHD